MPIQRSIKSPRYEDYQFPIYPRPAQNQVDKEQLQQQSQVSPREVDNINEIRRLIREQSNLSSSNKNIIRHLNSNSDSSDELEVPVRRFTPLPDIPRSDDAYFRTESRLIKDKEILISDNFINDDKDEITYTNNLNTNNPANNLDLNDYNPVSANIIYHYPHNKYKKETRYHFGSSTQNKINYSYRLPALEKQANHSIQNTMDLDEDLPMNPVSEPDTNNSRQIYTSPGDRIISPIKRPQVIFFLILIKTNKNGLSLNFVN